MKLFNRLFLILTSALLVVSASGCSGTEGNQIVDSNNISKYSNQANVVIVDMQTPEEYANGHMKGAVNIPMGNIVVNTPVENMLAPKEQIEKVMGENGISNNTTVIVYDNANNMQASRLWWTLMVYGYEDVKVISGGLNALKADGNELTTEVPQITPATFTAKEANKDMIASTDEVKSQVETPQSGVVILDTRTPEEYSQGRIPGAVLMNYLDNNYKNGKFKNSEAIKYQYVDNEITKDKTVIMYCKTSVRGAETYLALYNAGYRNLKLYDGAWLEWSSDKSLPVEPAQAAGNEADQGSEPAAPSTPVQPGNQDNS